MAVKSSSRSLQNISLWKHTCIIFTFFNEVCHELIHDINFNGSSTCILDKLPSIVLYLVVERSNKMWSQVNYSNFINRGMYVQVIIFWQLNALETSFSPKLQEDSPKNITQKNNDIASCHSAIFPVNVLNNTKCWNKGDNLSAVGF